MGPMAWVKLLVQNRRTIFELVKEEFRTDWGANPRISVHALISDPVKDGETSLPNSPA
jgi:hypothetical protein